MTASQPEGRASGPAKLHWYLQRLQKMSPSEVAWRAADQTRKLAWAPLQVRPGHAGAAPAGAMRLLARVTTPRPLENRRFRAVLPTGALDAVPEEGRKATIAAADEIMAGRFEILGVERSDMKAPDWFFDPVTGRRAPQGQYCFKVEHRDEEVTGNIKQVWELSRMHHVTVLSAAYAFSGDESYAQRVAAHLRSWWRENPFLSGVHWTSGIELGVRLISWAWARRLLEGWAGANGLFEDDDDCLRQIWWHQRYLAGFVSRGSSANNHVIAEATGQLVAALAFPWFKESAKWAKQAAALLERELDRNTFPSGVNREMAFEYHGLVAELGLVAGAEADLAGEPLSAGTWQLLCRMLDVVAATVDERLQAPRYGDGDDGKALVLGPDANRWATLLSTGRTIFGAPSWWPITAPDVTSALLASISATHDGGERPTERRPHFADAGLTILRTQPTLVPEIWCRCDSGPQGFLSIAAHGHADALSVEVRHGGVEILSDPGTYCYHGEPQWRGYFRSTVGHNTLELGGQDQSTAGGPFLWSRQAKTRLLDLIVSTGDADDSMWSAEHDGYDVLDPPAIHRRTVRLDPAIRQVEIVDQVLTAGQCAGRLAFHFGPAVRAELDNAQVLLEWESSGGDAHKARMDLPGELSWRLFLGEEGPVLGWYSPSFGVLRPSITLVGTGEVAATDDLRTVVRFSE